MDTPRNSAGRRYAVFALTLFASAALVFFVVLFTQQRIEANQRAWFVGRLNALVPLALHDNDLYADRITASVPDLLGATAPIAIFRARLQGQSTAAVLTAVAPDGYGGAIELLIGVDYNGKLLGIDVLRHSETQGIGDGFAPRRSNWLSTLVGRSLDDPKAARWTIRKDGGEFDQFTGASITPRALLKAVRRTLEYYVAHRDTLFSTPIADSPRLY